jgi:hypothetical protein
MDVIESKTLPKSSQYFFSLSRNHHTSTNQMSANRHVSNTHVHGYQTYTECINGIHDPALTKQMRGLLLLQMRVSKLQGGQEGGC